MKGLKQYFHNIVEKARNLKPLKIVIFIKNHYLYILIGIIYYWLNCMIFHDIMGLPIGLLIIIYISSIAFSLTPAGEFLFRQLNNVRELYTRKEKEYLMPIFEEVYSEIEKKHPDINPNIGIYISDEMTINACAIGRQTVAVNQGAIETLSREELKGLLAHEFGHIVHGDTKINMLIYFGSGMFSIMLLFIKVVMIGVDLLSQLFDRSKITSIIINIFLFIASIIMICFTFVIEVGIAQNSRVNESKADMFAHEVGFGAELISAFYLMQKTSLSGKDSIAKKIKATHPHIARRIGALEKAEGVEYQG